MSNVDRSSRFVWFLAVTALLALVGALLWTAWARPDVAYLKRHDPAQWIICPTPANGYSRPPLALETFFERRFMLKRKPPAALVKIRALGRVQLT